MLPRTLLLALLLVVVALGCAPGPAPPPLLPGPPPPNVLLVVLDDVGVDATATWGLHPEAPPTPTLDALAAEGVRFTQAWATPACAPSRATVLTGRHGHRTGVGGATPPLGRGGLPLSEVTLAEVLEGSGRPWTTAAIGKWHLGTPEVGGADHPRLQGFDRFLGTLGNLGRGHTLDGRPQGYHAFERVVDGVPGRVQGWAPTVAVDDALQVIGQAAARGEPWLVYLALHAAHAPFQPPPPHLLDAPLHAGASLPQRYRAIVQAADRELGRLLAAVDLSRTVVVVVGDNGTPPEATTPPFQPDHAKRTMLQGGIHVPLVIAGAGVAARGAAASVPVHTTDLLPTLAELAGVPRERWPEVDGVSLAPWLAHPDAPPTRATIYTEWFAPAGVGVARTFWQGAVRDERYKLMASLAGRELLVDLLADPLETTDLLAGAPSPEVLATRDRLRAALVAHGAPLPPEAPPP